MAEFLWLVAVAGGPILLAIVVAYALVRNRRRSRTRSEERAGDQATRDLYRGS